jgi:hypothetical protein
VKVTIQHADTDERRTLGVLEFVPKDDPYLRTFVLPETPVTVDGRGSLVLRSAYSPDTRGLSVVADYHTPTGTTHVFTGVATWSAPPYFAFRLPTGQFIEFYFDHDNVA